MVVGAGSAGLYATRTLLAYGYEVLLIEATDRIGGRVKSATLGDMRVELGAEEHYRATGDNPVWPAIRDYYGASVYGDGYQGASAYSMDDGTETCWDLSTATRRCRDDADVGTADEVWSWYWRPSNHEDPDTTLAQDVFTEFGVDADHRAYHLYDAGFAGGSYATSLDRLGARSLALQSNQWDLSEGIQVLVDKDLGYSDALETVWWDAVVAQADLLVGRPVVQIDTRGDDVVVTDDTGARHAGRQVIVTVPIGVLQAETITFVPDLPDATVDAYNGIGMDMGMKVAMRFSTAWWETEGSALAWLVTEGPAGACWVPSDYKSGTTSFILMCYPMGRNAELLNELAVDAGSGSAGDAAILQAVLADLDATFPGAPGMASAHYEDGLVQNWGAEPYILGAYSYPMVGTFPTASDNLRMDLQQPVAGDRIFFAGEATSVARSATVPGALAEGERAADAVHAVNGSPSDAPAVPE
ncbi:MAG TPA: amine oxidase [Deltaproteobacteria bacterium]|nr:amine oxidase [Deltaproteobacteria bacterium]